MDTHLIASFWWLIFPIGFMTLGIVRMVLRSEYQRRKLDLYKAYLAQGKDIPDALKRDPYC